ncbi:MAG: SpoIIE family protein phosphatase [Butyrivibrio sp.]|nr:SpoIIE family protein phosphatase [Butyrivibrio sp.]
MEAQGRDGKMFGPDRMMEVLNGHRESPSREVCRQMSEAVAEFVGDDPQFDDLTMLGLTYLGAQGKEA